MNIFILDWDTKKCAEYHCDKHVNKMIVEHLQMISVALAHYGYPTALKKDGTRYSARAYKNHPCTLWVKQSIANLVWLIKLTRDLCGEFSARYGKQHAGLESVKELVHSGTLKKVCEEGLYPDIGYTNPALCMPEQYKNAADPVQSYRSFYIGEKKKFALWSKSAAGIPHWWV